MNPEHILVFLRHGAGGKRRHHEREDDGEHGEPEPTARYPVHRLLLITTIQFRFGSGFVVPVHPK